MRLARTGKRPTQQLISPGHKLLKPSFQHTGNLFTFFSLTFSHTEMVQALKTSSLMSRRTGPPQQSPQVCAESRRESSPLQRDLQQPDPELQLRSARLFKPADHVTANSSGSSLPSSNTVWHNKWTECRRKQTAEGKKRLQQINYNTCTKQTNLKWNRDAKWLLFFFFFFNELTWQKSG